MHKYIERKEYDEMSHSELKSFRLNKAGNPELMIADSNVRPLIYHRHEYYLSNNPNENIQKFCIDLLEGTIQPRTVKAMYNSPHSPGSVLDAMVALKKRFCPDVSYDKDLFLDMGTMYQLDQILAKSYGLPMLKKQMPDMAVLERELAEFNETAKQAYIDRQAEFDSKGLIPVNAAGMSDTFPGYDVLYRNENREAILTRKENYGNRKLIDNSDHSAVFLGDNSTDYFNTLREVGRIPLETVGELLSELEKKSTTNENVVAVITPDMAASVIANREPVGRFMYEDGNKWVTVDNSTKDAFTEVFGDKYSALTYLKSDAPLDEFRFEIYQLKDDEKLRDYHFADYFFLKSHQLNVEGKNYNRMYEGEFTQKSLEGIFEEFNINRPRDFYGHSLSVSDIIVLRCGDVSSAYYVNDMGFKPVPEFIPLTEKDIMNDLLKSLISDIPNVEKDVTCVVSGVDTFSIPYQNFVEGLEKGSGTDNPGLHFTTAKDAFNREYGKDFKFSDIQALITKDEILYERPEHKNMRLVQARLKEREERGKGMTD